MLCFMLNGELLMNGYVLIFIFVVWVFEFNELMVWFYVGKDGMEMM